MTCFGVICDDCLDPFFTPKWQPPFICGICAYNRQKADDLIAYQNYHRRILGGAA